MQEELVIKLYDAYQYLRVSNAYDTLIEKYRNNSKQYKDNYYKLKNRNVPKTSKSSLKLTLVAPAFVLFVCIFAVDGILGKLFSFLAFGGVLLYGFLSRKSENSKSDKLNNKFNKEANEYWQKIGGPAQAKNLQEIQKIQKEKEKFTKDNSEVLEIIPYQYRLESTVGYLLTVILNKRADNLKEALNLYEEELHRIRVENSVQGIMNTVENISFDMNIQMSNISSSIDTANSRLKNIENLEFYQAFIKEH